MVKVLRINSKGIVMTEMKFISEIDSVDDPIAFQEHFYAKGWTDGLPVVPPIPGRVAEFLEYSGYQPSDVITVVPTRNRTITAEKVAINCVMAGCLPEYMPVVVAALEAMSEPYFAFHASITSTGGSAPFMVVNGPIRHQLEMNSDVNVLGPGNRANSTIGRAMRLIFINVADARPGILDKSTQGHGGKYSFCMAEAEEVSPWEPFHVEAGYSKDTSTVTVFAAEGPHSIQNHTSGEPEELMLCMSKELASIGAFSLGQSGLIISPEHAGIIAKSGWSKAKIKEFIYEKTAVSLADLKRYGKVGVDEIFGSEKQESKKKRRLRPGDERFLEMTRMMTGKLTEADESVMIPRGISPDDILMVVAGGLAGGHSAFVPSWSRTRASLFQTKVIKQPK